MVFNPKRHLKRATVDKWACFECGVRFKMRREIRRHNHFHIGLLSDFLVEFPVDSI